VNILMLGRWLPPPRRPLKDMREYHFARHLARSHRLTLAFITDNPDSAGPISALRGEFGDLEFAAIPRGWKSLASAVRLATGESCTLSYFRSEALRTRLADRLRRTRYDLVFVSSSSMIHYALDVDLAIPMVMDFGSVGSEWWLQQAARGVFPGNRFFRTEASRLRAVEATAARRAALCVAETPEAAGIVASLAAGTSATVVPSGVDASAFPAVRPNGKVPTVIFNTSLGDEVELGEVLALCRAIVPAVRVKVPNARFVVASRDPVGSIRGGGVDGVEVLSPSTDRRLLFHDQAVAAAPRQAGVEARSSVLEPMAAGIPVVTTSKVRERLGAEAGRDLCVADAPPDFARQLIELLQSGSRREEMGARGRRFVGTNFSWEVSAARLEELLVRAGQGRPAKDPPSEARPIPAVLGG
jgi:glycosyltransferase involved in cell wall biosynthesis